MCQIDHSRPTGTRVVGVLQLVSAILVLLKLFGTPASPYYPLVDKFLIASMYIINILNLVMGCCLVFTSAVPDNAHNKVILRRWIAWTIIYVTYLILSIFTALAVAVSGANHLYAISVKTTNICLTSGLSLLLQCVFAFIVYSYYEETVGSKNEPVKANKLESDV